TNITAAQVSTGVHVFNTTAGELTCEKASFTSTMSSTTAASISLKPTYTGCHRIIFGVTVNATVNFNGCTIIIYSSGSMDIKCEVGKEIEMTASGCSSK